MLGLLVYYIVELKDLSQVNITNSTQVDAWSNFSYLEHSTIELSIRSVSEMLSFRLVEFFISRTFDNCAVELYGQLLIS